MSTRAIDIMISVGDFGLKLIHLMNCKINKQSN